MEDYVLRLISYDVTAAREKNSTCPTDSFDSLKIPLSFEKEEWRRKWIVRDMCEVCICDSLRLFQLQWCSFYLAVATGRLLSRLFALLRTTEIPTCFSSWLCRPIRPAVSEPIWTFLATVIFWGCTRSLDKAEVKICLVAEKKGWQRPMLLNTSYCPCSGGDQVILRFLRFFFRNFFFMGSPRNSYERSHSQHPTTHSSTHRKVLNLLPHTFRNKITLCTKMGVVICDAQKKSAQHQQLLTGPVKWVRASNNSISAHPASKGQKTRISPAADVNRTMEANMM